LRLRALTAQFAQNVWCLNNAGFPHESESRNSSWLKKPVDSLHHSVFAIA